MLGMIKGTAIVVFVEGTAVVGVVGTVGGVVFVLGTVGEVGKVGVVPVEAKAVVVSSLQPINSNLMEISSCHVRGCMRMTLASTGGSSHCDSGVRLSEGPLNT